MSAETIQKKAALLADWHRALRVLQVGNFLAATHFGRVGKRLGVPVVIATSAVSSAIFATLGDSEYRGVQLGAGFLSLLATVLSSLQTFLGYGERAAAHKEAAVGYGELRTQVQLLLTNDLAAVADLDDRMESLRTRWNAQDAGAPTLPGWLLAAAEKAAAAGAKPVAS